MGHQLYSDSIKYLTCYQAYFFQASQFDHLGYWCQMISHWMSLHLICQLIFLEMWACCRFWSSWDWVRKRAHQIEAKSQSIEHCSLLKNFYNFSLMRVCSISTQVALKEKETNLDDFEFSGSFLMFTKKKKHKETNC